MYDTKYLRHKRKFAWWPTVLYDGYVAWLEFYILRQTQVGNEWITVEKHRIINE